MIRSYSFVSVADTDADALELVAGSRTLSVVLADWTTTSRVPRSFNHVDLIVYLCSAFCMHLAGHPFYQPSRMAMMTAYDQLMIPDPYIDRMPVALAKRVFHTIVKTDISYVVDAAYIQSMLTFLSPRQVFELSAHLSGDPLYRDPPAALAGWAKRFRGPMNEGMRNAVLFALDIIIGQSTDPTSELMTKMLISMCDAFGMWPFLFFIYTLTANPCQITGMPLFPQSDNVVIDAISARDKYICARDLRDYYYKTIAVERQRVRFIDAVSACMTFIKGQAAGAAATTNAALIAKFKRICSVMYSDISFCLEPIANIPRVMSIMTSQILPDAEGTAAPAPVIYTRAVKIGFAEVPVSCWIIERSFRNRVNCVRAFVNYIALIQAFTTDDESIWLDDSEPVQFENWMRALSRQKFEALVNSVAPDFGFYMVEHVPDYFNMGAVAMAVSVSISDADESDDESDVEAEAGPAAAAAAEEE